MKTLIFLMMFISVSGSAKEPDFHFMDCIQVIHGFYSGCKGRVKSVKEGTFEPDLSFYDVSGTCKEELFDEYFETKDLKKSDCVNVP